MTSVPSGSEWETPPYGSVPDAQRRAAVFLWVTAAAEMLFFGCCATLCGLLRLIPLGQLKAQAAKQPQQLPPDQLAVVYGLLWAIAAALLIGGFLPGLAYGMLGFGVRAGRRMQTYIALLLCTTQVIVFGTMLLLGIAQAIATGNAQGMTVSVLLLGSLLLLLGFTIHWLFRAKAGPPDQTWNGPSQGRGNYPPGSPPPPENP